MEKINQTTQLYQQRLLNALDEATAKIEAFELSKNEPIAIIGLGCRFPGNVNDPESFWQLLRNGVDAITEVPSQRWNTDYYDPNPDTPGKIYTRYGGFLSHIDQFEPQFFGISPREAISLDPQQRLLLEVSWEALENAGQSFDQLKNSQTGIFVGIGQNDYAQFELFSGNPEDINTYSGTGNGFAFASGRLSYALGLQGPNVAIDTACSSSLVAVHLACQSLRAKECKIAITGGVHLILTPEVTVFLSKARALSADGRCKTFDASADGYGRGEGCGMLVLKRLSDAMADGDNILALIRGSAVNHNGTSSGITVPSKTAQQKLISQALANAKVESEQVKFVEVHGTGTSLGDPIEVRALSEVFGTHSSSNPLFIGSVKTNIGHLEAAAGIAGLIKVVLALQNKEIPPNLHFHQPNPYINWDELPFVVPTSTIPWAPSDKQFAGISSFGISGTNAHVILEAAPTKSQVEEPVERPLHLLALSAKTESALLELTLLYEKFLVKNPDLALKDICFTANTGRKHFQHRLSFIASNNTQMRVQLVDTHPPQSNIQPKIAFLFTGQGSQYINMGRQLYETQPTFRKILERCDEIVRPYLEQPLLQVLYPDSNSSNSKLDETAYAQPALFAIEYALTQLWKSWGIEPTIVMGHSLGEYVAACVAGVFSLDDALKLVTKRGSLMQSLSTKGKMLVVFADLPLVSSFIKPYTQEVTIAAINGAKSIVISGASQALEKVKASLTSQGIATKELQVSHAFHSPLMEPMLQHFEEAANEVVYSKPQINLISNVTGEIATSEIATPQYWCSHVKLAVRFADSMEMLHQQGYELFLEIGPKPTLLGMGRQCLPQHTGIWLASLSPEQDDWQIMLQSLGVLYTHGAKVDWFGFDKDYKQKKVILPTYPFQRQRYWVETSENISKKASNKISKIRFDKSHPHPLLGQRLYLAGTKEIRFESQISQDFPAYLRHHRIYGQVIVPASAYLEMAIAAGSSIFKDSDVSLQEVIIQQALVLLEDSSKTLQFILNLDAPNLYAFQIFSFNLDELNNELDDENNYTLHVSGKILLSEKGGLAAQEHQVDLTALQAQYSQKISITSYYEKLHKLGIDYGSSFQAIVQLWRQSGQAFSEIRLPETLILEPEYKLHPVLLDACLQIVGSTVDDELQEAYLPIGLESLQFYRCSSNHLWTQVNLRQIRDVEQKTFIADLCLFDEWGNLVAQIKGLTFRRTSHQALKNILHKESHCDWLYKITWQPQTRNPNLQPVPLVKPSVWLLFTDNQGIGDALATLLKQKGERCIVVNAGQVYRATEEHYTINPANPEDFHSLLRDIIDKQNIDNYTYQVVYLWGLEEALQEIDLNVMLLKGCGSVLHLVQALVRFNPSISIRLFLITRGTQSIGLISPVQLQQTTLWGLNRVIALEHPELCSVCLDLDPIADANEVSTLLEELRFPDNEDQLAYRSGVRYVARLVSHQSQIASNQPFSLKISSYGLLENLTLTPMRRRLPQPGEVEIQVYASGLNFRDVLNALGLLQEYTKQLGIVSASEIPFGGECAGKIVGVGENISHLKVGDEVIAVMAIGCMSSFVTVNAEFVVPKPPELSFEAAATIPTTFLTAYYGLYHQAQMQRGDKVLIHAAAGGVGQAAIQLAKLIGAEVFATASPSKWEFLKSTGIENVMNSRSLDFAEEVMNITKGQGVDIVLNSLNGEFISKSLLVLEQEGRFVEIGKIGTWDASDVKQFRDDVFYYAFDLLELSVQNPGLIASMLKEIIQEFKQGHLKPLPYKVFSIERAEDAFRYMAAAKHVGKVVISIPQPEIIRKDSSYLITGGLGSLGLKLANWLVEQGASHIVLAGRNGCNSSSTAPLTISQLERNGAKIIVSKTNVSVHEEVAQMLKMIESLPPLRGIIHAAGVLDDGMLLKQTWERFDSVMQPKVLGAWNLHNLTQHFPLDFFVCFSSSAALLGSPGQSNYAAANAFMDALAYHRQALGLPSLSINWGPWADGGMATEMESRDQARWTALGVNKINPQQGLEIFAELLKQNNPQIGVLPINWSKFLDKFPQRPFLEFYKSASTDQPKEKHEFIQKLETANLQERKTLLMSHIRLQVAKVLGLQSPEQIAPRQGLFELGLDSLMAIELKNQLENTLGQPLRSTLMFDYPTLEALVDYLSKYVLTIVGSESEVETEKVELESKSANFTELSEGEIAELLAKKLASLD